MESASAGSQIRPTFVLAYLAPIHPASFPTSAAVTLTLRSPSGCRWRRLRVDATFGSPVNSGGIRPSGGPIGPVWTNGRLAVLALRPGRAEAFTASQTCLQTLHLAGVEPISIFVWREKVGGKRGGTQRRAPLQKNGPAGRTNGARAGSDSEPLPCSG